MPFLPRPESAEEIMVCYGIWIHDRDELGQPLDAQIVKAAEKIAPRLIRYRQKEVACESTTNRMLQAAVEAASKAKRSRPIENAAGYLTFAYRRIVDKFLARQHRVVPVDDRFLEDLANSNQSDSFEERIHNRLMFEKLLMSMDPDTRRICNWRVEGYSVTEIATHLRVTPNCLSVRYMRGLRKATRKIREGNREPKKQG